MCTSRLSIRRFRPTDLENLFRLLSDKAVMEKLEPPYTREKTDAFLHDCGLLEEPLIYAVENRAGDFVGYVIYHPYDEDTYELGWVLEKSRWSRGYASELTQVLVEDSRSKNRDLVIECLPSQAATKRIAEKHGFTFLETREGLDVYRLFP